MQMERAGKYDGTKQYAKDKRRMVAYAEEFARRWQVRHSSNRSHHDGQCHRRCWSSPEAECLWPPLRVCIANLSGSCLRCANIVSSCPSDCCEQGSAVGSYSMHPGWTETNGARTAMAGLYNRMEGRIRSPPQGADTAVWLSLEAS